MQPLKLVDEEFSVNVFPAICMITTAELINHHKWDGNSFWYLPLLIANALVTFYHAYRLKKQYYTVPVKIEVFQFEEKLRRIEQAKQEVKNKLNDALKSK